MDKQNLLTHIESFYPYLLEFNQTGRTKIPLHIQMLMKQVWQSIMNGNLDLSCSTCVVFGLNQLQGWYEKTAPAKIEALPEQPPAPAKEEKLLVIDKKKPCTDCKKKTAKTTTK